MIGRDANRWPLTIWQRNYFAGNFSFHFLRKTSRICSRNGTGMAYGWPSLYNVMVLRMLSTTTWHGLQPAMCFSNSSQTAGSTVPSTYSFNIANSSSHFMVFVSLRPSRKPVESYRVFLKIFFIRGGGATGPIAEPGRRAHGSNPHAIAGGRGAAALSRCLRSIQAPRPFL